MFVPKSSTFCAKIFQSDVATKNFHWNHTKKNSQVILSSGSSFVSYKNFLYPSFSHNSSKNALDITATFTADVFSVQLTKSGCSIQSTLLPEIQLFYFTHQNILYLADTITSLLELIPKNLLPALNLHGVLDYCIGTPVLKERTLFMEIGFLSENQLLTWNGNTCQIKQRESVESQLVPYPRVKSIDQATTQIISLVDTLFASLPTAKAATTLSGGIDSAFIAHRASFFGCQNFLTLTLPPEDTSTQPNRLKKLQGFLSGSHIQIPADSVSLLIPTAENIFDPYENPYASLDKLLVDAALSSNMKILLTGIGGDDFFSVPLKKGVSLKKQDMVFNSLKAVLSSVGEKFLIPHTTKNDAENMHSLITSQMSFALYSYSLVWKRSGVWPVSPFSTRELIAYSLNIPDKYLFNKEVLRRYIRQELSLSDSKSDSFAGYFERQFSKLFSSLSSSFFSDSMLYKSTLFNTTYLDKLIQNAFKSRETTNQEKIFLVNFIRLQLFLQKIYGTS